jgi:uncharacterized protein (DUF697 family)
MSNTHLMRSAYELVKAPDKLAEENLPREIADIVKLHAKLAVASALISVPGADMVAAAANIWAMYGRINSALSMPFSENVVKSVATGAITNIGAAAAGLLVLGSAVKVFPGLGSVGGAAIMAATVYGVTIAAGFVYMNALAHLLRRKSPTHITEADLKQATEAEMGDKAAIKEVVCAARDEYKKTKNKQ